MSEGQPKEYVLHPKPEGGHNPLPSWMVQRSWLAQRPTFAQMLDVAERDLNQCLTVYPLMVRENKLTESDAQLNLECKAQTVEYLRTVAELNAPSPGEVKEYRREQARKLPQGWCVHGLRKMDCPQCIDARFRGQDV